MIDYMFNNNSLKNSSDYLIYIDIFNVVSSLSIKSYPLEFSLKEMRYQLSYKYEEKILKDTLDDLSFSFNKINKGYLFPNEIESRNYYQKPFLKNNNKYIFVNPLFNSYGFYDSLYKIILKDNHNNGSIFGVLAENLVEKLLQKNKISYLHSKEYRIPKKLGMKSEGGECDFIIENKNTIFFIELKRKTLTTESRKGNILQAVLDLTLSFLHAISQAARHELVLYKQGYIDFTDGSQLLLKDRNVERVALSLFDFYSMHDGMFTSQVLKNLINGSIQSDDKNSQGKVKDINKYLAILREQYKEKEFEKYVKENYINFINCRFMSVPQLMVVLDNTSDNESFEKEIFITRHMSTSIKDWYRDYYEAKNLLSL